MKQPVSMPSCHEVYSSNFSFSSGKEARSLLFMVALVILQTFQCAYQVVFQAFEKFSVGLVGVPL